MVCRGWKASAPLGGSVLSGLPGGRGLGFILGNSRAGKSRIVPDQLSTVSEPIGSFPRAERKFEYGATRNTMCQSAAASTARFGMLLCTQQSRKYGPARNARGATGPRTNAPKLLARLCRNEPHGTASFGSCQRPRGSPRTNKGRGSFKRLYELSHKAIGTNRIILPRPQGVCRLPSPRPSPSAPGIACRSALDLTGLER